VLLGGRGRLTNIMGDLAGGIKSFRKGLSEEEKQPEAPKEKPRAIEDYAAKERDKTGV
jgi:sec-independent protein translocase protein TatA